MFQPAGGAGVEEGDLEVEVVSWNGWRGGNLELGRRGEGGGRGNVGR